MDAMPTDLPDPVSFPSEVPGVRHFCGHDVHTTIALGAARDLAAQRESLPGTIKFIFQPAEEAGTGARAMIDDGVLENPTPDAIFGLHVTNFEVGQIAYREGPLMPEVDVLQVSLSGTRKLQSAARYYRREIANVTTKNRSLEDFIQVQYFIDDYFPESHRWDLSCVIWVSSEEMHLSAKAQIEQIFAKKSFPDISLEYTYTDKAIPGVYNDPSLTRSTYDTLKSSMGEENILFLDTMISRGSGEDFSFYQQAIPGTFYFLGASNRAKGIDASPHTARFAVDEEVIFIGVELMKRVLVDYLEMQ
jgi:amidohydrolase